MIFSLYFLLKCVCIHININVLILVPGVNYLRFFFVFLLYPLVSFQETQDLDVTKLVPPL